jgi:hypothetical protein
VLSIAIVAIVPALVPSVAQVNDWPLLLFVTLTASEAHPLYSTQSLLLLTLAVLWARALV